MAESFRDWVWPGLLAVLLVGAAAAQTAPGDKALGTLTGKLTDLRSAPLDGATVVVRNEATGVETRGITRRNGSFRFSALQAGVYVVEAESPQLGRGQLEGVVVPAGHETRVQAAMTFEPIAERPVQVAVIKIAPTAMTVSAAVAPAAAAIPLPKTEPIKTTNAPAPVVFTHSVVAAENVPAKVPLLEVKVAPLEVKVPLLEVKDPLLDLKLIERRVAESARNMPTVDAQVLIAGIASKPLLFLNLVGSRTLEAAAPAASRVISLNGPTSLGGIAMREEAAVSAVTAAIDSVHLLPNAVHPPHELADSATPSTATTLSGAEIRSLPAAGRRWQDFVLDTPAAVSPAGGTPAASLGGAAQQPAETSIDGASTRLAFGGNGSSGPESSGPGSGGSGSDGTGGRDQNGMGQAWAGGHGAQVAEAAIREVQTEAGNAEVEGSRTAGGRVNVETARGTNGLHGQGFAFDRQNTWGAQNPFTQWVTETAPATLSTTPVFTSEPYTPPDHESVWGVGVGSQIRRDKLFWFGAVDSYRRNDPGLATVKHPDEFFAQPSNDHMQLLAARLGLNSTNAVAEGLNVYSGMLGTLVGLLGPAPRTAAQWVGFGRLDWQAAERHRFTLEGIGGNWNSPGGGLTRVSETSGTNSFGTSEASEGLVLGRWEAFLTPNLLAVTQASIGRNILSAHAETPSAFEQTFFDGGVNGWGQLPQIVVDNRYGFTIGNPSRFGAGSYPDERVGQVQESLDWVRGNLQVKGGFELSHNADATGLLRNETGTYTYSSVENFASDALVFAKYGIAGESQADNQHNCDETGKVWRDSGDGLRGLGNLPCYSYYSQVIGPSTWNLSTNDWAGFTTAQWQPRKLLVVSGGLRWEREQLPPPIALLNNPGLPLTEKLPSLGNDWGPRISMAFGGLESHWPVLRLGYGMYFGRTENATVETALTQTGSANGDLSFFLRPTDNLNAGGAPPFPYVLRGQPGSVVKPGVVEFAPNFRNPEIHQAVAAVEEELPGHVQVTASALLSLGRRLPISVDANLGAPTQNITYNVCDQISTAPNNGQCGNSGLGPIKATQITVPFYASLPASNCPSGSPLYLAGQLGWCNPNYQQVEEFTSKANSTYEAAVLRVVRYGRRGLSLHAHYTYAHAVDWNPGESPLDPAAEFRQEYGTSDLDMRHSAAAMVIYEAPWKLHSLAGQFANGWMMSGIGQFRSGLPYTMRTSGSLAEEFDGATAIVGLGPGMNGSGGDNRVYGMGSDGRSYNIGRNTFRYPATWKADMRVGKKFDVGRMRELELLVESFNLFNHQNVTELETTGYYLESGTPLGGPGGAATQPTLNFLTGLKANTTAFGQPLNVNATNFYRERQIQIGVRMRF